MVFLKEREILVFVFFIGYSQASPPFVSEKPYGDYRSITEDFNGTIFQIRVRDADKGDTLSAAASDDITREYFSIITVPNGGPNDVWINVTVKKPLDRETLGSSVKVQLNIRDRQNSLLTYAFTVYITDVNDNKPVFLNLPYILEMYELPCNKTKVYKSISATDKDSNVNGRVTFSMTPRAQSAESRQLYSKTFSIDSTTGHVTLNSCLDYETNRYYQFTVTAKDSGPNGGLSATVEFIIFVLDVQDKPPFFTGLPYRTTIRENFTVGRQIVKAEARDGDPGVSNAVNYTITNCSCGSGLFDINSTTGFITTLTNIDRDSGIVSTLSGICLITVLTKEIQHPLDMQFGSTTTSTTVAIIVQDIDDNAPVFEDKTYHATVPENTPKDVPISLSKTISVTDLDQGNNAHMNIYLKNLDNSPCKDFTALPSEIQGSGKVTILVNNSALLDYEVLKKISIKVVATEAANPGRSGETTVHINILDRNDNYPQFNSSTFEIRIKENTENDTIISQISATDADTVKDFKSVTYSLSGGSGRFTVDKDTGDIRTSCTNCTSQLDREKRSDYYMTFFATDNGGNRNSTEVKVLLTDVNDNRPMFSRTLYTSFFEENVKRQIVKLEASDRDEQNTNNSKFSFSIVNSTDTGLQYNLTLNSSTGELGLLVPVDFEALQNSTGIVNITVAVTDMGNPRLSSTSVVQITVQDKNDNTPYFNETSFTGNVNESQSSNTTFQTNITRVFAYDKDFTEQNKKLSYFKTAGSDKFTVDPSTGMVSVRMNAKLDRETDSMYSLTIIAIDQGIPPLTGTAKVTINVIDVNDEKPQFDQVQYTAKVKEDETAGFIVCTCGALDKDGNNNLVYNITKIAAHDENGKSVNEMLVMNYFDIHGNNGSVYVSDELDRETAETITLEVQVKDENASLNKPQTDTATLTITLTDINDNHPSFTEPNYTIAVAEDAGNGKKYDGAVATDRDVNRTITYELISGPSPINSFKIENSTGILVKVGELDRETNGSIALHVVATDNGVPRLSSTVTILVKILDANDNAPEFSQRSKHITTKHIEENTAAGTDFVNINATDVDEGPNNNNVTYYMEQNSYFKINETTGIIYVSKSPDREVTFQTKLTITAKDNPVSQKTQRSSSMTITVYIDDVNDNSPTFAHNYTQNVEEDKAVGSIIIQVTATDKDEQNTQNSNISYEIDDSYENKFSIDTTTGEIKINSSLIDFVGTYQLTAIAYDHGSPRRNGSAFMNITVTDKNRHKPVIGNLLDGNELRIYECAKRGTVVHTFNYTDQDHGINADATFNISILQDDVTGVFNLTKDGRLTVVGKLTVNIKSSYQFGIIATDHGTPPLSSDVVKIMVTLIDVNDHLPSFKVARVTWHLQENTTYSNSIGKVTAFDNDTDSKLCYKIADSCTDYFSVNESNGKVFSVKELDHEVNTTVTFDVSVNDCSLPKNISDYCDKDSNEEIKKVEEATIDTIKVAIDVIDIDDSPPVFRQKQLATGIRGNTEAGMELELHLRNESYISDADTPQNGILFWVFSNYGNVTISPDLQDKISANSGARPCEDNIKHIFCVTREGAIVNNRFFSEDLSGYFVITVKVADKGGYDTANVTIYLISDTQVVTMTIRKSKGEVALFKDNLLKSLSRTLGHPAVFDSLRDHKENGDIVPYSSDLSFHIVDNASQAVLSGKDAIELFEKQANNAQMIALQNQYAVIKVAQNRNDNRPYLSSNTTFKNWNFENPCNKSGFQSGYAKFPHPASRNQLLICDSTGHTYLAYCPPGEIFHTNCSVCAKPGQDFSASCVETNPGLVNPCTKENIISGNLTFSHPGSSTKYIRCDTSGKAWVEECFSGSVWDQRKLTCVLPMAYNPCHQRGSLVQSLYPHYCDPRLYIQCDDSGQPLVHTCQKNYVFLTWDLTCVPPAFPGSEYLRYTCQ